LGMNRGYVNSGSTATTNFFGFDLAYDKTNNNKVSESNGAVSNYTTAFYNGNIAGMSWRGQGSGGTGEIRRYDFSYDNANRLMKADFKQYAGSGFDANGNFTSQMGDGNPGNPGSAYDLNGNIQSMTQQGLYQGAKTTIDQLTYTYNPGSNKLLKVKDAQTTQYNLGDFHDGISGNNNDYFYDANGNLTQDLNKNISTISYNMLNLPELIYVDGRGGIAYLYDAAGNKLSKTVYDAVAGQKITTYLGSMIFENDVLQHVGMEEGRFRPNGTAFTADYFLKDHLGNVRSMINEDRTLLEETHYYPFGLTMKGVGHEQTASNLHNKRKYNGIEFDEDLGIEAYEAFFRNLDPQTGRWWQIDPKIEGQEDLSPYNAMANDPIKLSDPLGDEPDGDGDGPGPSIGTRIWGAVKAVGGVVEMIAGGAGGVATSWTGLGAVAGGAAVVHGADVATAGFKELWTGQPAQTFTVQGISKGLQAAGVSEQKANTVAGYTDAGVSIVLTAGVGLAANASKAEMVTVYRGVNESHPGFTDALKGNANPRGGTATAAEHNAGNTSSKFTSWTTNKNVAVNYAKRPSGGGVVMSKTVKASSVVKSPSLKNVVLKQSGKKVNESEFLLKGKVRNANVEHY
ncbi:MAG: hypothetical protein J7599_13790, partial [Niabella sp.]|nr:hypothetical protein [Niabella sp.]